MDINFKYSHIYEQQLNPEVQPLTSEKIKSAISNLERFWKDNHQEIKKVLKQITGLAFTEQKITCYINSKFSFSDPLTLGVNEELEDVRDTLVHELIHVILLQNNIGDISNWKAFMETYKGEKHVTRVHIVVHAIHQLVAEKIFPDRVQRIKTYSKMPAYMRSWEIVNKEGAHTIVSKIFS